MTQPQGADLIAGQVANTLVLSSVEFAAAAGYKCTVVYQHSLGTLESPVYPVFVQGNLYEGALLLCSQECTRV